MTHCQWDSLKVIHPSVCLSPRTLEERVGKLVWKQFERLKTANPSFPVAIMKAISRLHMFTQMNLWAKRTNLYVLFVHSSLSRTHLFDSQDKWVHCARFVLLFVFKTGLCPDPHLSKVTQGQIVVIPYPNPIPKLSSFSSKHPTSSSYPFAYSIFFHRHQQRDQWTQNNKTSI